jgi:hypothetical protein
MEATAVERSAHVAVILQPQIGAVGQPGSVEACAGVGGLRVGKRDAGYMMTGARPRSRRSRPSRSRSPARARRRQTKFAKQPVVFRLLRRRQRLREIAGEQRRRVGHRGIEPQRVERIAEIVVRDDVAAGLATRVRAQQMADAEEAPHPPAAVERALERGWIGGEQRQKLYEIGRVPLARDVTFGESRRRRPSMRPKRRANRGARAPRAWLRGLRGRTARAETMRLPFGRHQMQRAARQPLEQGRQHPGRGRTPPCSAGMDDCSVVIASSASPVARVWKRTERASSTA